MLRLSARDFLCGHADAEHKFQLASIGASLASDKSRKHFAVEVEAREGVRVSPTQAIGQAEVDELLHLRIGGRGVGRPAKGCDDLASVNAREIVPELDAIAVIIERDDERAEGSVDVERGVFFIFHTYRVAQIMQNARDFFTIVQIIFVDDFSNVRFILQVGTLLEQRIA